MNAFCGSFCRIQRGKGGKTGVFRATVKIRPIRLIGAKFKVGTGRYRRQQIVFQARSSYFCLLKKGPARMIRPNLRRFLSAALALLAVPCVAHAQHAPAGPPQPVIYAPQYSSTPQLQHEITGDYSLWDESRPIERFLSETVQQSWLRLEFMYMDFGDLGSGFVGAPVTGLNNGPLPGVSDGRNVPIDYNDNLTGGTPAGATLIPTYDGLNLDGVRGIRGTWGVALQDAEMELSFFGTGQKTAVRDFGDLAAPRIGRSQLDPTIDPELGLSQVPLLPGKMPFAPNYAVPLTTNGVVQDIAGANALVFNDTLTMSMGSQVWGAEMAFLTSRNAPGGAGPSWQWLGGFRYLNLDERFNLTGTYGDYDNVSAIVPNRFTSITSSTINNIYGPEFGGRLALTSKYMSLSATPRVMFGLNDYQSTVNSSPNSLASVVTQNDSIDFSTASQLNLLAEFNLSPHFSVFGGYDFLCITSVTRPQDNIEWDSTTAALGGVATPNIHERTIMDDFFFAQGFSFGGVFRY
ncbi:MAG TPA: hypothetical protein DCR20_01750 [Planctomycetaceae bacterium]|nr:hypothetical protein [Planctomycetaceae bacterium]